MDLDYIFSQITNPVLLEDYSEVKDILDNLKKQNLIDIKTYLQKNPDVVIQCVEKVKILDINNATIKLFKVKDKDDFIGNLKKLFLPESLLTFEKQLIAIYNGDNNFSEDCLNKDLNGNIININLSFNIPKNNENFKKIIINISNITSTKKAQTELEKSTKEWAYAMDFIEDAIYLIDLDDKVVRANKTFYMMTGLTPEQVIGKDIGSIIHPEGEEVPCPVCQARMAREDALITMEADHPDNPAPFAIEVMVKMVRDDSNETTGVLMGIHNLGHIRKEEEYLRLSEKVFNNISEAMLITDENGFILKYNALFEQFVDGDKKDLTGIDIKEFSSIFHENIMQNNIWDINSKESFFEGEIHARRKNGDRYMLWFNINKIINQQGKLTNYLIMIEDITEKKSSQERIYYLANYDELTGLPNRNLFNENLALSIEKSDRYNTEIALLFIDLDNFKMVNDSLGHELGDLYLNKISKILSDTIRRSDFLARIGGDEFVIIINKFENPYEIEKIASKILEIVTKPVYLLEHEIISTCSIGISLFPDDGNNCSILFKNADTAMYSAKNKGGNFYNFFDSSMNDKIYNRLTMEQMIREALKEDEFSLNYQPQYTADGNKILGLEALIRWNHPEKGFISPFHFITIAEESNLILKIGEWVLNQVCKQISLWKKDQIPTLPVAINFSARQLHDKNIISSLKALMQKYNIEANEIECEITESTLMENLESSIEVVNKLHEMNIKIAIDDFGTGYSSLNYLKRFPLSKLKIDKSFIDDVEHNQDDEAIARAIISLGHSLNLKIVAEGVENSNQRDFLVKHNCDVIQGYLYSKPLPSEEVVKLI